MSTKEKIIVQSFWTKPMNNERLSINLDLASLSLYYAHRSGYIVHMHTDSVGMELLKDYGYDSLLPTLDEIPSDIPGCIFAYGKILAIEREPIGAVHTDLDVFIKKPLIDRFFEDQTIDVVLQCEEIELGIVNIYNDLRSFFHKYGCPPELAVDHMTPANVGVIGFNNLHLRDEYIRRYKACAEYYKGTSERMMDLFFEQINLHYLVEYGGYRVWYILGAVDYRYMDSVCDFCDRIGYQHLQGEYKYTPDGLAIIRKYRETLCGY